MSELYVGLLHVRGAYIYGAARADGVLAALAAMADCDDSLELLDVEWLQTYDELPERGRQSEPIQGVLEALGDGDAALDWAFTYPEDAEPDPADVLKEQLDGFVDSWIEAAVERFGAFELGDYAFVAEMKLDGETEVGWAYQGSLLRAAELFERAAEDARDDDGVDGGDG